MPSFARTGLELLVLGVALAGEARAQITDVPAPLERYAPVRPRTRQELDRLEARKLYGLGLLCQHQDRLLEATRTFEAALKFDPEAVPVYRALIPLYLALARVDDALGSCRKTLDLCPEDFETWQLYGQQLKFKGQTQEARTALNRGVVCAGAKERPDLLVQMYFDLGVLAETAQDVDAAVAAFGNVVRVLEQPEALLDLGPFSAPQLKEQAANTCERIVKLCIQGKQYDRALQFLGDFNKRYPELGRRLSYHLAQASLAQNQPEVALRHLNAYLQTLPQGVEGYELRATVLRQLGKEAEIVPALEEYVRRDPLNTPLKVLLAREYGRSGQAVLAERAYRELAAKGPSADVYRGLFNLYKTEQRMGDALSLLDSTLTKAAKRDERAEDKRTPPPDPAAVAEAVVQARFMLAALREDAALVKAFLPAALERIRQQRFRQEVELNYQTRSFLAVLAARTRQLEEAEHLYRACLPQVRTNPQLEIPVYSGLLQVLWQAHKYEAIVQLSRQGLLQTQMTNRLLFHDYLSRALLLEGKPDEALAEVDQAVPLATDVSSRLRCRLLRVRILAHAERVDKAEAECRALLQEHTQADEVRDIRYALSNVYATARDHPKSQEQLELILKADPNDATANNDLGYLWADQGKNLDEAERMIRKAIDLDRQQKKAATVLGTGDDEDNAAYLDSLGWVLFRRGQLEAARQWLEKSAALPDGADDPVVWDHLGDVYCRLEAPAKARAAYRRAVQLYETERRRKADDRLKEVRHKLEMLDPDTRRR